MNRLTLLLLLLLSLMFGSGCVSSLVFSDAKGHCAIGKPSPDATPENPLKGTMAGIKWSTPGGQMDSHIDPDEVAKGVSWGFDSVIEIAGNVGKKVAGLFGP